MKIQSLFAGGDVLWAGIPMVTLPGENFAQRVAAGLTPKSKT